VIRRRSRDPCPPSDVPRNMYIKKMSAKRHHQPVFNRQYLVLLAVASIVDLKEAIPHLASSAVYGMLIDAAYPHHASRKRKHAPLKALDADADF